MLPRTDRASSLIRAQPAEFPAPAHPARAQSRPRVGLLHLAALALVLVLAGGLRVAHLNALGYNSDEAVYAGQGAAIAQVPVLKDIFPVFRAHPLLFQFTLALSFAFGAHDWLGRAVSVAVGLATVYLVYCLGRRLYGPPAGLVAAFLLAVMPYHVVVTRQVLLDGPMVLCATLSLFMMARFGETKHPLWLYAAAAGIGLTFLAKETGFIMVGAIYAFLALSPKLPVRLRDIFLSLAVMIAIMAPFPLSVSLAGSGGGGKTQQYLVWQLFRRPNHIWDFYPTVVPPAIGFGVLAAALVGFWLLRRENGWRERLLVLWIVVPVVFFQLWPTKGFQYLLPAAPPLVLLAARTLTRWPRRTPRLGNRAVPPALITMLGVGVIAPAMLASSWERVQPTQSDTFLAGSGGIPGGREAGRWVGTHVPDNATFMTIGPSMANIIKFYGHQQAFGLSVSPNPLHRNPSYEPIHNPDFQIRLGELQYLVWDSFSAGRSTFFSEKLLSYVQKYNGRAIHTQTVSVTSAAGEVIEKPVIIVYEVHP